MFCHRLCTELYFKYLCSVVFLQGLLLLYSYCNKLSVVWECQSVVPSLSSIYPYSNTPTSVHKKSQCSILSSTGLFSIPWDLFDPLQFTTLATETGRVALIQDVHPTRATPAPSRPSPQEGGGAVIMTMNLLSNLGQSTPA